MVAILTINLCSRDLARRIGDGVERLEGSINAGSLYGTGILSEGIQPGVIAKGAHG